MLAELELALYQHTSMDRLAALDDYLGYMARNIETGEPLKHMARHLLGLFTGIRGARTFRRELSTYMFEPGSGIEVVQQALAKAGLDQSANLDLHPTFAARTNHA